MSPARGSQPWSKQGHCAGQAAGTNGEVEADADGPLALLVNPFSAAGTKHQPLLRPPELCNKADNKTGSDASSLIAQAVQQNEKL